jgi:hypothetical protein
LPLDFNGQNGSMPNPQTMKNSRSWFIAVVSLTAIVLTFALAGNRREAVTAPSVGIDLTGSSNILASWPGTNTALRSRPVTDLTFTIANVGDRSVYVTQDLQVEFRPQHFSLGSGIVPTQTNLFGIKGRLGPGETKNFVIRCLVPSRVYIGGGTMAGCEVRATCQTGPAESGSRFVRWMQHQTWSKYLPKALREIEVDAYTFSSSWVPIQ